MSEREFNHSDFALVEEIFGVVDDQLTYAEKDPAALSKSQLHGLKSLIDVVKRYETRGTATPDQFRWASFQRRFHALQQANVAASSPGRNPSTIHEKADQFMKKWNTIPL